MKINRVELKNYRNHKEITINFSNGINLLLGKNGAGKSSILEAIGLALFNTGNRSNALDTVTIGENSASILVEFQALDGIEYIVERKVGKTNNHKLYKKGENSSRVESTQQVVNKVMELVGIETNAANIYENIITAYQNEITRIFSQTGREREAIFNRIFDTEIYGRIYKEFSKAAEDNYKIKKESFINEFNRYSDKLKDNDLLSKELSELINVLKTNEENLAILKNEIQSLDNIKKEQFNLKQQISNINSSINNNKKLIDSINENISDTEKNLKNSEDSLNIVNQTKNDYENYNTLSSELKILREKIKELENYEKNKQKLEKELNSNIQLQTKFDTERISLRNEFSEKKSRLESITSKNNEIEKNFQLENELQIQINNEINKFNNYHTEFNKYLSNLKNSIKQSENQLLRYNEKQKGVVDTALIDKELVTLTKLLSDLQEKEIIKVNLDKELATLKSKLDEVEKANKKLSAGICPYLKEDCENIKKGTSIEEYFSERKSILKNEIVDIIKQINLYESVSKEKSEIEKQIHLLKNKKIDGEKIIIELDKLNNDISLFKKDIELVELKIQNYLNKFEQDLSTFIINKDYDSINEYFNTKLSELKSEYHSKNTLVLKYKDDLKKSIDEKNKLEKNINEISNKEKENIKLIADLKLSEDKIKVKIEDYIQKIQDLPSLKIQESAKNKLIEEYRINYDKYITNKPISEEINTHINKLKNLNTKRENVAKEQIELNEQLQELSKKYSEDTLKDIENELKSKNKIQNELINNLSTIKANVGIKKNELKLNKEIEISIKETKKKIKELDRKLELTKVFRENINNMGRLVASRLLAKIEISATENYRRISNKNEEIKWLNSDEEKYTVILRRGNEFRNFKQLSGGEQVTVAIALRSAMASLMTKANFAIFDEPTNNLDIERKVALSESLKEILKNLNQAIIVTHDDSFREMAQNTISI